MSIKNLDGTPYVASGSVQQYDPSNPEHDLFNLWDEEIIRIGGSPIMYYEVFINTGDIDTVYNEARNKIFSNNPVQLYGLYEPIRSQNQMMAFGFDSPDQMMFELNYNAVLCTLGHMPKIGSRLYTPHLRENWEIVQLNRGEFKLWGALRLQIVAVRYQESVTTGEGRVTQSDKPFEIR